MLLKDMITKDDFTALWNIDTEYDLTEIANEFYDFYLEEELINSNVSGRFKLKCVPHLKNLIYDIKRWEALMNYTPENIRKTTQNSTSTSTDTIDTTTTDNGSSTNTDKEGYAGYGSSNQNSNFKQDVTTLTDSNTQRNTGTNRNNSTGELTSTISGNDVRDMKDWYGKSFKNIYYTYYIIIRNELFIGEW